jgi:hypothetical protein
MFACSYSYELNSLADCSQSEKEGSPPRELIKVSGSMPLSLASERKRFNPSWASRSRR